MLLLVMPLPLLPLALALPLALLPLQELPTAVAAVHLPPPLPVRSTGT